MRFLIVAAISILAVDPGAPVSSGEYAWPMDAPPALTSTYAEYRSGRFHAGLDVKTWGKEGYPCVAVADGYVWRVRTSPWGYGKAVYLKLVDGRTAVYAHLSAFSAGIDSLVTEEQDRRGAYSVNLFWPADKVPVKRGDTIAFSGSTGSGLPHLHFEIRDAKQRPLNPARNGFDIQDTIAPTLLEVALIPLDASARVDGRNVPMTRVLRWVEGQGYVGAPASLWGRVGVAIKAYDRADASSLTNKLAPYRLSLSVDDARLFVSSYDVFSYDQVYEVDLDRSFVMTSQGRKGFHNLYVERGNTLPLYDGLPIGSGVIAAGQGASGHRLAPGPHRLSISASDAAGNAETALIDLTVREPVTIPVLVVSPAAPKQNVLTGRFSKPLESVRSLIIESSLDAEAWQWMKTARVQGEGFSTRVNGEQRYYRVRFEDGPTAIAASTRTVEPRAGQLSVTRLSQEGRSVLTIASALPLRQPPSLELNPSAPVDLSARSAATYEAVVPSSQRARVRIRAQDVEGGVADTVVELRSQPIRPTGGEVISADGKAMAIFGPGAIYFGVEGGIEPAGPLPAGVDAPIGQVYRFEPSSVPFREMVQVHLEIPAGEDPTKLGVYELMPKGWSFVWNDVDSTRNTVWAGVRHFSTYALLRDDEPPEVSIVSPMDGSSTSTRPSFEVVLKDTLSGIPMEELISFKLDGKTMIFEYDPEEDIAKGLLRTGLRSGKHELVVRVRDTNRNETVAVSRFEVQE